ncbi:MAG TPA: response regulator transcription factor [Ferruginibacter sp.]|jgi:two-component system invasion response regulator UvrY|nr:response regulator transcription factor [Ferruginibacter sp.]
MNPKLYNVVLVDDHILLRDALASLINTFEECHVMNVAGNGKELLQQIETGVIPCVVLLDLNMPVMDGYETASWLHQHHPEVNVIILTMYDSEIALIRLLQVGVKGFLKKDVNPDELRAALISVAGGDFHYSHGITGKLATLFQTNHDKNASLDKSILNEIEIEFLKLASTDMTYKEIADVMSQTPRMIDNHRDALFVKLNVKSRVGLAIYAIKNGIVTF